jgi:acetyl-CoA carboxylase biotin carboxylase subunit
LNKILIANRGEIAVRIIRTCREMGLGTVAVYSECDRNALHVRLADEAHAIGPDQASESYLRIDKLVDVGRASGADAVHPGYGFLAENADFAEACSTAGLTFIGPSAAAMRAMGSKTTARDIAAAAGVPVVPGGHAPEGIGYPLLVKAVAGGGGKGMRVVRAAAELDSAVALAKSEARSSFNDDRIFFERLLERPRHIEVQLLGDLHGTIVPFVERECSIQRRHQKLIEETPSPSVTPVLRERLMAAAAAIGRAASYSSAGTIEFLVDATGEFFFLEMNTRLQVEHPITEAVTGVDFVRAQIEIARGARLADVADLKVSTTTGATTDSYVVPTFRSANGHAIEVRVYAENPDAGFLPSPGRITHLRPPSGPGIRDDSGVFEGWTVPTAYDPLVSKVVAWAPDRSGAIARMDRALTEYDLRGIDTTIAFCRDLVRSQAFAAAAFDTTYVDRLLEQKVTAGATGDELEEIAAIAAAMWEAHKADLKVGTTRNGTTRNGTTRNGTTATGTTKNGTTNDGTTNDGTTNDGVVPTFRSASSDSLWAQRARLDALR